MSEEEKIVLIYRSYGYADTLKRLSEEARRSIEEAETRILSDLLSSSIGSRLLEKIRVIVREEVEREIHSSGYGDPRRRYGEPMEKYDGKT